MRMVDEVRARARARFVGRVEELTRFRLALDSASSTLLWVFGPGGIGKSTLLSVFADVATTAGREVVMADLRSSDRPRATVEEALSTWVDGNGRHEAPVVLVDALERSDGVDRWLRDDWFARLPSGTIVVIAGRRAPSLEWRSDPLWSTVLELMPLRALSVGDAHTLLDRLDVAASAQADAIRFGGGHPLALSLLAQLLVADRRRVVSPDLTGAPDLVAGLLARLVDDIPDGVHRHALEIASLARVTTQSLLRAVLGADADSVHAWLEDQPYIDRVDDGLCPHDLVRDLLEADLRRRDPDRYAAANRSIRSFLLEPERMQRGPDRCIKDFIYLHRSSSLLSGYWDWATFDSAEATPLRRGDEDELVAVVTRHDGGTAGECLRYWLRRQPEAFTVVRSVAGAIQGVIGLLTLTAAEPDDVEADPTLAAIWAHAERATPRRPGTVIGVLRFFDDAALGQRVSPTFNVLTCELTRHWLLTRGLSLDYIVVGDRDQWAPMMGYIDFHEALGTESTVGGTSNHVFVHDWRGVTPAEWIDRMEALEVGGPVPLRSTASPVLVALGEADFAAAVRSALRDLTRPARLADNPLTGSRVARDLDGTGGAAAVERVVRAAFAALMDDPRTERARRAVARTYLHGAVSQEAAAEVLGMAFSTYRRHLAAGVELLIEQLWRWELYGRDE